MGVIRVISLKSVSSGANYVKVVEVRRILFVTKNVAEKNLRQCMTYYRRHALMS